MTIDTFLASMFRHAWEGEGYKYALRHRADVLLLDITVKCQPDWGLALNKTFGPK